MTHWIKCERSGRAKLDFCQRDYIAATPIEKMSFNGLCYGLSMEFMVFMSRLLHRHANLSLDNVVKKFVSWTSSSKNRSDIIRSQLIQVPLKRAAHYQALNDVYAWAKQTLTRRLPSRLYTDPPSCGHHYRSLREKAVEARSHLLQPWARTTIRGSRLVSKMFRILDCYCKTEFYAMISLLPKKKVKASGHALLIAGSGVRADTSGKTDLVFFDSNFGFIRTAKLSNITSFVETLVATEYPHLNYELQLTIYVPA